MAAARRHARHHEPERNVTAVVPRLYFGVDLMWGW
jgi:hypothetical protein